MILIKRVLPKLHFVKIISYFLSSSTSVKHFLKTRTSSYKDLKLIYKVQLLAEKIGIFFVTFLTSIIWWSSIRVYRWRAHLDRDEKVVKSVWN